LDHGVFNDSLFVSITDFGIQKRAAYALNQFLTGVANKQLQQDLNKAIKQRCRNCRSKMDYCRT
jgi:hypothetical protein